MKVMFLTYVELIIIFYDSDDGDQAGGASPPAAFASTAFAISQEIFLYYQPFK
jgi:hypothetical protein